MKTDEILQGIENDIKGSSIEEAASIILDLCSISNATDLKANLFKDGNLAELLSLYKDDDAIFNRDIYKFVHGLLQVLKYKSSLAVFVCRVYLELRGNFNDAGKLLSDEMMDHFIKGLTAFGRSSYDKLHADEFMKEAARHFYEIYHTEEFIPKAAFIAVDRCINELERLISTLVPPLDENGHEARFEKDVMDGYMNILSACAKKKEETE